MSSQTAPVGVIGLGEMGAAIATRLTGLGTDLVVYDIDPAAALRWPPAMRAESVASLASRCPVILIIVATDAQALTVVDAVADTAVAGTRVVLHSTVAPTTARATADTLAERGITLVDAGMSRGQGRMRDGSLTLFAGGAHTDVDALRSIFGRYSDTLIHAGPTGTGMVLKLCNNLALHGNRTILIEAVRIATAAGLDTGDVLSGIVASTGTSWVARHWGLADTAALADGAGQTAMTMRTQRELGLIVDLAHTQHIPAPAAELILRRLPSVLAHGLDATDRAVSRARNVREVEQWRSARDRAGEAFWSPLLVLTTTGAKTGRSRACLLEFVIDDGRLIVFGSDGGRPADPAWCHNIQAHPRVTIEIGSHAVAATAVKLPTSQADDLYGRLAAQRPDFARYRAQAGQRAIPVIHLDPDVDLSQIIPASHRTSSR